MLGITQYSQDYDGAMPLCVKTADGAGSGMIGVGGITQEFGVPVMIQPYIKSAQIFQCPDDSGFAAPVGVAQAAGQNVPAGKTLFQAYGTSYKFNFDSFSIFPQGKTSNYPMKYQSVSDKKGLDKAVYNPATATSGTQDPPFPMSEAFVERPSETLVMHCYLNNWSKVDPTAADGANRMHDSATLYAFADGHVKALLDKAQSERYCDGPTYSPVRNASQPGFNAKGDGSCNTGGVERNKN